MLLSLWSAYGTWSDSAPAGPTYSGGKDRRLLKSGKFKTPDEHYAEVQAEKQLEWEKEQARLEQERRELEPEPSKTLTWRDLQAASTISKMFKAKAKAGEIPAKAVELTEEQKQAIASNINLSLSEKDDELAILLLLN